MKPAAKPVKGPRVAAAPEPQQLALITDPDLWGADVETLKEERKHLRASQRSEATHRAYESDWKHFIAWCATARRDPMPASEETVELYIAAFVNELRISTIRRRVSAIAARHITAGEASPVGDGVRATLFGAARKKGTAQNRKAALTPHQLLEISRALPNTAAGARDRMVMVLGFASGCRRSELAALNFPDDVTLDNGHGVVLTIRSSKTDKLGAGDVIGLRAGSRPETCPVAVLKAWLKHRGKGPGPLIRRVSKTDAVSSSGVTDKTIADIVHQCVSIIGLDPSAYAGHSLRAGMITAAAAAGAPDTAIMRRSRHKSVQTLARYIRHANALSGGDILATAL